MDSPMVRRPCPRWTAALGVIAVAVAAAIAAVFVPTASAGSGTKPIEPASVLPLDRIAPEHREQVSEVIRDHTLHRKAAPETFPCNARVYLCLLNEPAVTLALWKDLSDSKVKLHQISPNRFEGNDGAGASAVWEFVHRSPKLHVLLCNLSYVSPRGAARLEARIVLLVHSGFYREVNGDPWVQHDVEAFVKIDSLGWKAVARTVRPVVEKLLEDQVREAGWFVSLMGRLVAMYPSWACQVTMNQGDVATETRAKFRDVVVQTRRPGAFPGRPSLAENAPPNPSSRTR